MRLFFFSFWFLLHSAPLVAAPAGLRVYFTANRQGEIEPCGCLRGQIGGLDRVKNLLSREASPDALFVDSGDAFFLFPKHRAGREAWEKSKARLIAESYREFGVAALAPGERDFTAGLPFLQELAQVAGLKLVSANLKDAQGKLVFDPFVVVTRGGKKIAVLGLTDPEAVTGISGVTATDVQSAFKSALEEARRGQPDAVVLLSHLGLKKDREVAAWGGVDLIVGSHSIDTLATPEAHGKTWIVQPEFQGQQIGIVDWKPEGPVQRLVDLAPSYAGKNAVSKLVAAFYKRNSEAARQEASTPPAKSGPHFVANAATCRKCHAKQTEFWESTKHSSAYLVLYSKNQHFDPECISCHSLGFQEPQGFEKIASPLEIDGAPPRKKGETPLIEKIMGRVFSVDKKKVALDSRQDPARYAHLKKRYHDEIHALEAKGTLRHLYVGVQCEHCHGIREGHPGVGAATTKKVIEASCTACHHSPHDEKFNFEKKKPLVACPLMAKD